MCATHNAVLVSSWVNNEGLHGICERLYLHSPASSHAGHTSFPSPHAGQSGCCRNFPGSPWPWSLSLLCGYSLRSQRSDLLLPWFSEREKKQQSNLGSKEETTVDLLYWTIMSIWNQRQRWTMCRWQMSLLESRRDRDALLNASANLRCVIHTVLCSHYLHIT